MRFWLLIFVLILLFVIPLISFAQQTSLETGDTGLPNPIGINDPRLIIGNIINAVLGIVGSLALAVFIYGGFTWVISGGNDEKVRKGKDMILWASIGLVIIFLSYALVTFVVTAVTGGDDGGGQSRTNITRLA